MNTVDSLKKLYKTMAGKDWPYDPNPTDAEVIDKIAADGNAGGSGGSGTGIEIIMRQSQVPITGEVVVSIDPLPAGLAASDFIDAVAVLYDELGTILIYKPALMVANADGFIAVGVLSVNDTTLSIETIVYDPATGAAHLDS